MKSNRELINALTNCVEACEACAAACLAENDAAAMAECIQADRDCADICNLAIQYLARGSRHSLAIIGICADICAECAEACDKHDHDHCQACAKACRRCEESCRAYLNQ